MQFMKARDEASDAIRLPSQCLMSVSGARDLGGQSPHKQVQSPSKKRPVYPLYIATLTLGLIGDKFAPYRAMRDFLEPP
jgi:hypothetical protein